LAYFGHASYNDGTDEGELIFRDDRLSYKELARLSHIPPIIFLVGCETASCSAYMGGLPAYLLANGAYAVLATLFPISADHAGAFLGRTFAFMKELINKGKSAPFSEIVFKARKIGFLKDNLDALEKNGTISLAEVGPLLHEICGELMEQSIKRGKELLISEAIPELSKYLKSEGLLESWEQIKPKIIPYSLFFTLLGNAHDVFVG